MTASKQATMTGRGLGGELRALREAAGFSCAKVAKELGWQASKISRMETGKQAIKPADVASLLVVYRVIGKDRDRLLKMAERTDDLGYWENQTALSNESKTLLRIERDATAIFTAQPLVIPGLLQNADYARALMYSCNVAFDDVDTRVAARMARQVILSKEEPPLLHAIMDETVLRRVLGSPKIMARQLRTIQEAAEERKITIQVLPFEQGGHAALDGTFHIIEFANHNSVIYLDHKISGLFLEQPDHVALFRREADKLTKAALSPGMSMDFVAAIAREYERQ
ncbi:helix-turn-helix protein [Herbihabitans rhizosphaerae]|uniref:Helix-turn-helix protein n=1 Tax=Herbihabitans rhizosphaerae TaxID=1872711 RepID=A0A4Q7KCD3_9PSEU|nr:helix-turn-helix transcriptional regulator [Herbihabitans rhizosphaerae]RZS30316.1 helix-turn-helix protein [Herbihabitans rhizosphaerae]